MTPQRINGGEHSPQSTFKVSYKLEEEITIEVEDDATADQWKGTFSAEYIQGASYFNCR